MKNIQAVAVNQAELRAKVKAMYRRVAQNPKGRFHFELGNSLARRLGYPSKILRKVPAAAIDSFAGVGYHFDLAALKAEEELVDLGSGSGMDCFVAAQQVGPKGRVVGVDMTDPQRAKAERLAQTVGFENVSFLKGYIEKVPAADGEFDAVISNGVVNLSPEKETVFREAARLLRPGGRLAISDIITEKPLTEAIVCDVSLWASCIGGAAQRQSFRRSIESAGLQIQRVKENPEYNFLSESAQWATGEFGVKSISVLAVKPS
jgi:arsenite methyltransferase